MEEKKNMRGNRGGGGGLCGKDRQTDEED
jgi:hypothetical protein